jgi:hypothetical protein
MLFLPLLLDLKRFSAVVMAITLVCPRLRGPRWSSDE